MLVLRRSHVAETAPDDRFRGTMQRWTLTDGARRATVCDYEFCADWSLLWRVVAGPRQGQVGRSRRFQVQQVRPDVYLITFAATPGATITAVVDFASGTLAGYASEADESRPFTGSLQFL